MSSSGRRPARGAPICAPQHLGALPLAAVGAAVASSLLGAIAVRCARRRGPAAKVLCLGNTDAWKKLQSPDDLAPASAAAFDGMAAQQRGKEEAETAEPFDGSCCAPPTPSVPSCTQMQRAGSWDAAGPDSSPPQQERGAGPASGDAAAAAATAAAAAPAQPPACGAKDSAEATCDLLVTLTMGNPLFEPASPGSLARIKSNADVELCLSNPCYDQEQEQAQGAEPGAGEAARRAPEGEGAEGMQDAPDGGEPGGVQGAAGCALSSSGAVESAVADLMVHNPVATPFAEEQQQQQLGKEEDGEDESPWSNSTGKGWEDRSSDAGGDKDGTEEVEEEEEGGSLFDNALLELLWGDVDAGAEGQLPQQQMSVAVPLDDIPEEDEDGSPHCPEHPEAEINGETKVEGSPQGYRDMAHDDCPPVTASLRVSDSGSSSASTAPAPATPTASAPSTPSQPAAPARTTSLLTSPFIATPAARRNSIGASTTTPRLPRSSTITSLPSPRGLPAPASCTSPAAKAPSKPAWRGPSSSSPFTSALHRCHSMLTRSPQPQRSSSSGAPTLTRSLTTTLSTSTSSMQARLKRALSAAAAAASGSLSSLQSSRPRSLPAAHRGHDRCSFESTNSTLGPTPELLRRAMSCRASVCSDSSSCISVAASTSTVPLARVPSFMRPTRASLARSESMTELGARPSGSCGPRGLMRSASRAGLRAEESSDSFSVAGSAMSVLPRPKPQWR